MMTGLDITGSVYPYKYKGSTRQKGVKTGVGYKMISKNICLMALCLKLSTGPF
jgi:hypothetical protein